MSVLRKLVPTPFTSAALLGLWLALARSASAGQLLLGLLLALVVPLATQKLRPTVVHVRHPLKVVRFLGVVGYDVLKSNFEVAWGVLTYRITRPQAKFVIVPLDLRSPLALAALSMVTTVVPGTVWSELALDRSALMLHVWNVKDEQAFIRRFKERYERPLAEIFT